MKKILNSVLLKPLFVTSLLIITLLVFRFIENQTIKTLIGMSGFTLMLYSITRNKKSKIV
jgi:hypothetical protein